MNFWKIGGALVSGAIGLTLAGAPAIAATPVQGALGTTSQGQIGISATIPASVQISKLSDMAFGTLDPSTATQLTENPCVWSNTTTKGYTITANGSGTANAYTLSNGTTTVGYGVQWSGTSGVSSGTVLAAGTASPFVSTATSPVCASGPATSASLIVTFSTAQMQAAVGSSTAYNGTLTLIVAPQ